MSMFFQVIFFCSLLVLAIIGFNYIFSIVERIILRHDHKIDMIIVLTLSGHIENVEMLIREIRASHKNKNVRIFFVDSGLDIETRLVCKHLALEFDNCILCDDYQLPLLLQKSINQ